MKKQFVSLIALLFLLMSEPGFLAMPEAAVAMSGEGVQSQETTKADSALVSDSEFFTPQSLDKSSESRNPVEETSFQIQASSISPTLDRDYDGLTDDVEVNGWRNAAGFFTTDPLDPDSDGDGLVDGKEKLYDTDPQDMYSPGIYVEYEDHLKTRQYFATEPRAHRQMVYPYPWGWQQYGDHLISFTAVVVRRGSSFSVGGPIDASIQITKSLSSLSTLTPIQDPCTGRWRISVPSDGTVGKYEIALRREGDWSESLKLYVIFELPTPTANFTQTMIDVFLYDDDRANIKDEMGILLDDFPFTPSDYSWIPSGSFIDAGAGYRFRLEQFEPFVFETQVIEAINGRTSQWDAAHDLVTRTDKVTRFNNPRVFTKSWSVLHPGPDDDSNQCSNISGLLVAFARAAGIPARPFFIDRSTGSFDHAVELWLKNTWYAARGYNRGEDACVYDEDNNIVWDCAGGEVLPRTRSYWGENKYRPWHSGGPGSSGVIMAADENWVMSQTGWSPDDPAIHEYRWASWDWDGIVRRSWFDTLFVPYWSHWGWTQEPQILGTPPSDWPPARNFSIGASPDVRTVVQGETANYTIYANKSNGFDVPVEFVDKDGVPRVTGLPANTTVGFSREECVPNCTSVLSIGTTSSTAPGTYILTIEGRGNTYPRGNNGLLHDTTVALIVTPPPDFTISADPNSRVIEQGGSTDYTVDVGSVYGFDGIVDLSVAAGVPNSTTVSFSPASCRAPCQSTLDVSTEADAPAGNYTLIIRGDSGDLHHQTAVQLQITASGASARAATGFSSTVKVADNEVLDNDVASLPAPPPFSTFDITSGGWVPGDSGSNWAIRGVGDYGIDLDRDGYFDQLVVEVEVKATQPGTYWLQGQLGVNDYAPTLFGAGGLIDSSVVRVDIVTGTAKIQFFFDGLRISAAKVDGAYVLKYLSVTNVDDPGPDEFMNDSLGQWVSPYTTSVYQANEFQNRGARLAGQFIEQGIDTDGDLLYESLILKVPLNVYRQENYTVQGDLYDGQERFVARATWSGTGTLALLQFDDLAGTVGPYTLRDVSVFNADGEDIDSMLQPYTTQTVTEAEQGTHIVASVEAGEMNTQGIFLDGYSDRGWDDPDDSDTLFDLLVINVPVEIEQDGLYHLEGWLGKNGTLISWGSSESYSLISGTQKIISVTFSGPAIHSYHTDGPFALTALKLVEESAYEVMDELAVAYETSLYLSDDFESLPYLVPEADQTIFFQDYMEEGQGNWEADSPWAIITDQYRTPTHSWTDSPGGNYGSYKDVSLTAPAIDLTQVGRPALRFQTCYALESNYDYGYVEMSTDGVTWTSVATYTGQTTHWDAEMLDLGMIEEGTTLQVRFRLETDAGSNEDGWYIDDVIIYFDSDLDDDGIPNDVEIGDTPDDPVDTDEDGTPDYLDDDSDNDGIPDDVEAGDDPANPADTDGDGMPDYLDDDSDNDGIPDDVEAGDDPANPVDTDGDGTPDYLDDDADGDGIPDEVEAGDGPDNPVDSDGDGTPDYLDDDSDGDSIPDDVEAGDDPDNPADTDGDGTPDYLDEDSDNDGILDIDDPDPLVSLYFIYLPITIKN